MEEELKSTIRKGWDASAKGYTNVVSDDFHEPISREWTDLILSFAPSEGKMRILDVGTGPGVFATLMSKAGHDAVGIDISDSMLEEARNNSRLAGASPEFVRMDSDRLGFPDGSFDMIISRNVLWIMPDPTAVYKEWFRVLRPGGRLLYFDGAHPARDRDYDFKAHDLKNIGRPQDGKPVKTSVTKENYDVTRGWKKELPLSFVERPKWDLENAAEIGFVGIECADFPGVDSDPRYKDPGREYRMFRFSASKPL